MSDLVERLLSPEHADVAQRYLMREAAERIVDLTKALQALLDENGARDSLSFTPAEAAAFNALARSEA